MSYIPERDPVDPNAPPPVDRREHVQVTEYPEGVESQHVVRDYAAERRISLGKTTQLIWLVFGILEGLIALRVILKLIAANPDNAFATFIYNITSPFLAPFFGLTGTPQAAGAVLEISSIIAMVIYALLAWVIIRFVSLVFDRPASQSVSTYRRDDV